MYKGHFYYISDQYFLDFPDSFLMRNKETKYRSYYDKKMLRYQLCDTLAFGEVLGREKAFLIQNMCPETEEYIKNEYIDPVSQSPVRIDGLLKNEDRSAGKNQQYGFSLSLQIPQEQVKDYITEKVGTDIFSKISLSI